MNLWPAWAALQEEESACDGLKKKRSKGWVWGTPRNRRVEEDPGGSTAEGGEDGMVPGEESEEDEAVPRVDGPSEEVVDAIELQHACGGLSSAGLKWKAAYVMWMARTIVTCGVVLSRAKFTVLRQVVPTNQFLEVRHWAGRGWEVVCTWRSWLLH